MTITLQWWMLPTLITVVALAVPLFWPTERSSYMPDLSSMILTIPALFVSMVAWIIYAVFK